MPRSRQEIRQGAQHLHRGLVGVAEEAVSGSLDFLDARFRDVRFGDPSQHGVGNGR